MIWHQNISDHTFFIELEMPYGDTYFGQFWLRSWLVAWRHQDITWTNVNVSLLQFCDIHQMKH